MLDQFGTITVRECRLTRAEVGRIVAENLQLRGPGSYEFDYKHPVMLWTRDGGLTVRWPSSAMRDEPGRTPRPMDLMPWAEFVRRQAAMLRREEERRRPPTEASAGDTAAASETAGLGAEHEHATGDSRGRPETPAAEQIRDPGAEGVRS